MTSEIAKRLALKNVRKAKAGSCAKPWGLIRHWAHQSFFYLDRTERLARVALEIVPVILIVCAVVVLRDAAPISILLWVLSLLLVHTLHWVFNSNWRGCVLFALPWLRNPGAEATCEYLNALSRRLRANEAIAGVMIYGSLCRGQWHDRSDLDVRILRQSGFANGIRAVLATMQERLIAVFAKQPLDVYLADDIAFLEKMRGDEIPIILVNRSDALERRYPESRTCELRVNDFIQHA